MAEFVVHSIPGSPFGRSVLATLEAKHADYRLQTLGAGGTKGPEHMARHPFGRIPTLSHGDFELFETQAIVRYLDRVIPTPALTPSDPRAAARMDQAMNVSDWYVFQGVGNVIGFQRVVGPRLMGLTPDEAAIAAVMPRAHQVFNALGGLLGDQPWFAGDQVSLADLMLAPQLDFMSMTPEWPELVAAAPGLVGWMERVNALPCMEATTWDRVAAMGKAA
jgi:glutathione S-transferase